MKLSKQTEWIVIGVLILYIAFGQPLPVLSTPLGKVIGLLAIVYVWKSVSAIVAVLLAIAFLRSMNMPRVWEMFSGAETTCTCEGEPDYMWDDTVKKCMNKEGKEGSVKTCVCAPGYAWDGGERGTKQCIAVTNTQPPIPLPTTNPVAEALAAPAVSTGPVTSSAPMTTPGAAAEMAAGAVPSTETQGVQPGATATTSTPAAL